VSFPKNVWNQLKGITCQQLIAALEKDGWSMDQGQGSIQIYRHPDGRRVSVHVHPKKTYGRKMLTDLLKDTEWTESDMRRIKLIK